MRPIAGGHAMVVVMPCWRHGLCCLARTSWDVVCVAVAAAATAAAVVVMVGMLRKQLPAQMQVQGSRERVVHGLSLGGREMGVSWARGGGRREGDEEDGCGAIDSGDWDASRDGRRVAGRGGDASHGGGERQAQAQAQAQAETAAAEMQRAREARRETRAGRVEGVEGVEAGRAGSVGMAGWAWAWAWCC